MPSGCRETIRRVSDRGGGMRGESLRSRGGRMAPLPFSEMLARVEKYGFMERTDCLV